MKIVDPSYVYDVLRVERVVDGDTVVMTVGKKYDLEVDFGFGVKDRLVFEKRGTFSFRLYGVNTPEVHGEAKAAGLAAKAELERLLSLGPIVAKTYLGEKYGRILAALEVRPPGAPAIEVSRALVDGGFAKPYYGEGPKP